MARYAIQGTVRDGAGNVLSGATVTIYPADSSTPATIYTAKTGGSPDSSGQVTTNSSGRWIVYLDDATYAFGSFFDVSISKTGYDTQVYEDER